MNALAAEIPRNGIESSPEMTRRVPAAASQLNLNVGRAEGLPFAVSRSRPGHWKATVRSARKSFRGVTRAATLKTATMMMYGA